MVEFQHVNKTYEGTVALRDVSFTIPKGKIFGLLGPNGAGKTTLLRMLVRILLPDSGQVLYDGHLLADTDLPKIGYLPEERGLYPKMRVDDHLLFLAQLKGMKKSIAKDAIRIWAEKLQVLDLLSRNVEELSKGQQQKVQLVAALLHEPDLLILDEPFSGFDPVNAELLKHIIFDMSSAGKTLLISTHRMENAEEICDELAMLHKGTVVLNGTLQQLLSGKNHRQFLVTTKGTLHSNHLFQADELKQNSYLVKTQEEMPTNEILQQLMLQTEIVSFAPQGKTLKELFLEKVQA